MKTSNNTFVENREIRILQFLKVKRAPSEIKPLVQIIQKVPLKLIQYFLIILLFTMQEWKSLEGLV